MYLKGLRSERTALQERDMHCALTTVPLGRAGITLLCDASQQCGVSVGQFCVKIMKLTYLCNSFHTTQIKAIALNKPNFTSFIGELETYHSALLKYAEKRRHYKYPYMKARIQLSVLDHNHNVGQQHATTQQGELVMNPSKLT